MYQDKNSRRTRKQRTHGLISDYPDNGENHEIRSHSTVIIFGLNNYPKANLGYCKQHAHLSSKFLNVGFREHSAMTP